MMNKEQLLKKEAGGLLHENNQNKWTDLMFERFIFYFKAAEMDP